MTTVFYDGACGVCGKIVHWLRRHLRTAAAYTPYQDVPESELIALGITRAQCAERLHVILPEGATVRGGAACLELLRRCGPPYAQAAALAQLPPFRIIVDRAYDAYAASRG